jgi:hypothetical protein
MKTISSLPPKRSRAKLSDGREVAARQRLGQGVEGAIDRCAVGRWLLAVMLVRLLRVREKEFKPWRLRFREWRQERESWRMRGQRTEPSISAFSFRAVRATRWKAESTNRMDYYLLPGMLRPVVGDMKEMDTDSQIPKLCTRLGLMVATAGMTEHLPKLDSMFKRTGPPLLRSSSFMAPFEIGTLTRQLFCRPQAETA